MEKESEVECVTGKCHGLKNSWRESLHHWVININKHKELCYIPTSVENSILTLSCFQVVFGRLYKLTAHTCLLACELHDYKTNERIWWIFTGYAITYQGVIKFCLILGMNLYNSCFVLIKVRMNDGIAYTVCSKLRSIVVLHLPTCNSAHKLGSTLKIWKSPEYIV